MNNLIRKELTIKLNPEIDNVIKATSSYRGYYGLDSQKINEFQDKFVKTLPDGRKTKLSITYLLLNQPAVRWYVNELSKIDSQISNNNTKEKLEESILRGIKGKDLHNKVMEGAGRMSAQNYVNNLVGTVNSIGDLKNELSRHSIQLQSTSRNSYS
jgi:hypothetical protein